MSLGSPGAGEGGKKMKHAALKNRIAGLEADLHIIILPIGGDGYRNLREFILAFR
jgi:hypothetical protein